MNFLNSMICKKGLSKEEATQRGLINLSVTFIARETKQFGADYDYCCLTIPCALAERLHFSLSLSLGHCFEAVLRFHSVIRRQLHTNNSSGQCVATTFSPRST